ncbi:hypothetical protein CR3_1979 [Cupriavidus gilardii CR3]|nr:hypothetical protein CR3_1979 [Cupriavidus gilardii CR3]
MRSAAGVGDGVGGDLDVGVRAGLEAGSVVQGMRLALTQG